MGYRYCPDCDRWIETAEYTVAANGDAECVDHYRAVHGFIVAPPWSEGKFMAYHPRWYDDGGEGEVRASMLAAAKRQGLVR